MKKFYITVFFICTLLITQAQEYTLVWEDNFDGNSLDSSVWNMEQRIGIWNTGGNSELQHYRKENVSVGDDGQGNNCLIITAKKESYSGYNYTSGRVNTKSKFSFRKGKVEARIKMPDLANGLWPAFWTLGNVPDVWPDCGEIDILEMGHAAGITAGTPNSFIGAHLHWGPYPSNYGTEYTSTSNLSEDYHLYKLEWNDTQIKIYIDDYNYFTMDITGETTEEFRNYAHYLLFNMAVGGSLTGITNASGITASFPASMYIDYVKIYQQAGIGDLVDSANVMFGSFGVYEETASVATHMTQDYDASIQTTGLTVRAGETPAEGNDVLSYDISANQEFSMAIRTEVNRNMTAYNKGSIQFRIKTESTDSILAGIADQNGNEAFVTLKEGQPNNPMRDGEWQLAWIQLSDLAGKINLGKMKDMLILKGNFNSDSYISIDRVIWSENEYITTNVDYYGVFAEHDSISSKLNFNSGGNIYTWSGFSENTSVSPFYGENVLAYNANTSTWNGFGIHSDDQVDLSPFFNGNMHFHYKADNNENIEIGFKNSNDKGWKIIYSDNSPLIRDNQWHSHTIPFKNFNSGEGELTSGDLKDIAILFYMVGTVNIAFDEIYFSYDGTPLEYPEYNSVLQPFKPDSEFQIYPNPSDNSIQITGLQNEANIEIYDLLGRMLVSQTVRKSEQINTTGLHSGTYLLRISKQNTNKVLKFIIK